MSNLHAHLSYLYWGEREQCLEFTCAHAIISPLNLTFTDKELGRFIFHEGTGTETKGVECVACELILWSNHRWLLVSRTSVSVKWRRIASAAALVSTGIKSRSNTVCGLERMLKATRTHSRVSRDSCENSGEFVYRRTNLRKCACVCARKSIRTLGARKNERMRPFYADGYAFSAVTRILIRE